MNGRRLSICSTFSHKMTFIYEFRMIYSAVVLCNVCCMWPFTFRRHACVSVCLFHLFRNLWLCYLEALLSQLTSMLTQKYEEQHTYIYLVNTQKNTKPDTGRYCDLNYECTIHPRADIGLFTLCFAYGQNGTKPIDFCLATNSNSGGSGSSSSHMQCAVIISMQFSDDYDECISLSIPSECKTMASIWYK